MVFSSNVFLFVFLPIVLAVYYFIGNKFRNYWLLFVSIFFYGWNQPKFLWIIFYSIILNYLGGLLIAKVECKKKKKIIMIVTIILNLLCLFYFKYFNLLILTIERLTHSTLSFTEVVLPIGISFFTFQSMSYVLDVYMNKVSVQKNVLKLALYVVLFPQLVAGPIVRYAEVAEEIDQRETNFDNLLYGTKRFIIGLAKKTIVANTLAISVDAIFALSPNENSVLSAWFGIICYTLQIYFDFSGYSDMAIGLGRMFGFHFAENFNYPYIARSIGEYWRRWHISLATWFRDYVYIPLGGNRKHVYINLIIVFALTGIWHGAAYQYIVWGIYNACFMVIERYVQTHRKRPPADTLYNRILQHIYALFSIMIGLVYFRASGLTYGTKYLGSMFGLLKNTTPRFDVRWYLDRYTVLILIVAILWSTPFFQKLWDKVSHRWSTNIKIAVTNTGLLILFVYSLSCIVMSTYNPFIYFQF